MVVQAQAEMGEDKVVNEEIDDILERAATTATSLDAEQDRDDTLSPMFTAVEDMVLMLMDLVDKGKGIMIEEPMVEQVKPMKRLNKIRLDEELAFKLQAKEEEEERLAREKAHQTEEANIAWDDVQAKIKADYQLDEEKARLFVQFLEQRRKTFTAKRTEEKRNKPPTRAQQRSIMSELQSLIEVVSDDEEEVAIDAVPLATKPPTIVDWKIHKEEKKSYYQIIKADGKSQMYRVFSQMLKHFSREDLEDLYKLVKAKYGSTRPVEDLDLILWGDLKTMIKRLLDDLRVTAAKLMMLVYKLLLLVLKVNATSTKVITAERVSTVRERIKTEERIKIVWRSRLLK
ncbi:hypothetical protein Tco_1378087 [Tanacetum coccineum]